jgi:hypothetical protein
MYDVNIAIEYLTKQKYANFLTAKTVNSQLKVPLQVKEKTICFNPDTDPH